MNDTKRVFTINSRKFDRTIHQSWKAKLIRQSGSLLTFTGTFEKEINHAKLGVIRPGTRSFEFYWLNRWYSIFRFHEPDGELRNFYCNVNQPPVCTGNVLDYIDLDIDVLVWKDFSYEILDLDEYENNVIMFDYPTDLKVRIAESLQEILNRIKKRSFPFN